MKDNLHAWNSILSTLEGKGRHWLLAMDTQAKTANLSARLGTLLALQLTDVRRTSNLEATPGGWKGLQTSSELNKHVERQMLPGQAAMGALSLTR